MKRLLTKRFGSYAIQQCEKKTGKDLIDLLDVGGLSVDKIMTLVKMGNNNCSDEEAGEILDRFLAEHSIVEALIQLLEELNADIHIFDGTGLSLKEIKKQFIVDKNKENKEDDNKVVEFKAPEAPSTELKNNESVKVDVNGFVSIDEANTNDY